MRKLPSSTAALLLSVHASLVASSALAQGAPPATPTQATAAPTAPAAPAVPPALPTADQLAQGDAMMAPLPPAEHQLHSWREALALLRGQNTSLAISRARIAEARAAARESLSKALPTLTATGSVTHHLLYGNGTRLTGSGIRTNVEIPDPGTTWQGGLELRQPLFDYKSWYDIGTGNDRTRVAEHQTANTERQLLGEIANTLVDLVTAERLLEISREGLRSSLATHNLTDRRAALGAGSRLDVLRAEQNVSQARAQLIAAQEAVLQARESLGMALGTSQGWSIDPSIKLDALAQDARQLCTELGTVADRADVRAALANSEAAERDRKSSNYQGLPTLDFVSNLNLTSQDFTANNKPVQWTVGAMLTIPLYDGGSRYASHDRAMAGIEVARQELTQVKRQAELEVQRATRAVRVAQTTLQVSTKTRDLAQETARLAQVAFLNGSGTSFDLVDTERQHREAELDLAIKELEVLRAGIAALLAQANCDI
jgi:outer membrane protein TolC